MALSIVPLALKEPDLLTTGIKISHIGQIMIRPNHKKADLSDPVGPRKQKDMTASQRNPGAIFCATPCARRPALQGAKRGTEPKESWVTYGSCTLITSNWPDGSWSIWRVKDSQKVAFKDKSYNRQNDLWVPTHVLWGGRGDPQVTREKRSKVFWYLCWTVKSQLYRAEVSGSRFVTAPHLHLAAAYARESSNRRRRHL